MKVVITIYPDWCKKCGICAEFCPKDVYEFEEGKMPVIAHPEKCIACELCVYMCPELAITVEKKNEESNIESTTSGK